jgi:hypothetical protein
MPENLKMHKGAGDNPPPCPPAGKNRGILTLFTTLGIYYTICLSRARTGAAERSFFASAPLSKENAAGDPADVARFALVIDIWCNIYQEL